MITLAWHEVISWVLALVSATLFIVERRRNDNLRYYMVLQGILRACHQRCGFLVHTIERIRQNGREVPRDEFFFAMESEYANYVALQEHIMGSMKSLQPDTDVPFDVNNLIAGGRPPGSGAPANQALHPSAAGTAA